MPRVFDTEVFSNYTLFMARDIDTGTTVWLEQYPGRPWDVGHLQRILTEDTLIGFNSGRYDLPLLKVALSGANCETLKQVSDAIIIHDRAPWQIEDQYPVVNVEVDHIDIMEPTPGVQVSLKSYAGRIHAPRMQDLPIDPSAQIQPGQRAELRRYCENDLDVTARLYRTVEGRINLRRDMSCRYGLDLRSKSDAQIAEAVLKHEVEKLTGAKVTRPKVAVGTTYTYRRPGFVAFQTPLLKGVLAKVCSAKYVVAENGSIDIPKELADLKITVGQSTYRMGIGGLHSTEKRIAHHSDADHILIDADVGSYYPNVILRTRLYPKHMGPAFLDVYRTIVTERLAAKHRVAALKNSGDKAELERQTLIMEGYKILLNGSFGKFGSKYSVLYSPDLLIQTTLTGQLALLMLIESLESCGIPVVSANTDGIVIRCPRSRLGEMDALIWQWEFFSNFEMEKNEYASLYSKDVNNYIAIKPDGSTKRKGLYADPGLMKNPTGTIVTDAVVAHLVEGKSLDATIRQCRDLTRFLVIRSVKGGGEQDGTYLGKTVRWYYSTQSRGKTINYVSNGYKVAKSEGARAVMSMPDEFPDDIDYEVYMQEAIEVLKAIGANT